MTHFAFECYSYIMTHNDTSRRSNKEKKTLWQAAFWSKTIAFAFDFRVFFGQLLRLKLSDISDIDFSLC